MNKNLEIILNFRKHLLTKIDALSVEQLNCIPENFSNNIIWNLAHLNAVLQALCYKSAGLPLTIEETYFQPFLPGTQPAGFIDEEDILKIKKALISTVLTLQTDLGQRDFTQYTKVEKIEKVYHIHVETIEDALHYVTHHEGIHYHAILTLKRAIENVSAQKETYQTAR